MARSTAPTESAPTILVKNKALLTAALGVSNLSDSIIDGNTASAAGGGL